MSIGDFISKTASEALGRIIAQAPKQFITLALSGAVISTEIDKTLYDMLLAHIKHVGTILYSPISKIVATGLYSEETQKNGRGEIQVAIASDRIFCLIRHCPLGLIRLSLSSSESKYYVTHLRGFNVHRLLSDAALSNEWKATTYMYYPVLDNNTDKADITFSATAALATAVEHYWPSPALITLIQEVKTWRNSRIFCKKKGLPWRRGWLLHGAPGNGKTYSVKLIANLARINLLSLNLNMSDNQFRQVFALARRSAPCIVLIEDIDDIIRGRQNVKDPEKGVSFSTLLNCIDGVDSTDGVIVAVTTNDLSAIDPALGRPRDESHWNQLSTRPGRLDRCIRFDNPDLEGRIAIGKLLLSEAEATALAHKHDDVSLVQFQALCREAAFANLQDLDAIVGAS